MANGEQTNRSEQQQNDTLGDQLLTNRKLRDHNNVVLEGIDHIGCKDLAELHCDQNVRQQKQRKLPRLPQGDPPEQRQSTIHEDVTQRECCFRKISIDKIICQPLQQAGGQKEPPEARSGADCCGRALQQSPCQKKVEERRFKNIFAGHECKIGQGIPS
ncbi:MAG: hypothetical protein ACLTG4_08465 [Oscillospiraceae bacterium]